MESAERPSSGSSRTPPSRAAPSSPSREARRANRRRRRIGLATTTTTTASTALVLVQLPQLLILLLLASSASAWSPAVFSQQLSTTSDKVGPGLRALEEGSECNATLYDAWYESPYSGALLTDLVDFWIFSDAELTNGQVFIQQRYSSTESAGLLPPP